MTPPIPAPIPAADDPGPALPAESSAVGWIVRSHDHSRILGAGTWADAWTQAARRRYGHARRDERSAYPATARLIAAATANPRRSPRVAWGEEDGPDTGVADLAASRDPFR